MIISASRRTDIPAFYAEWFMNRLQEGFVYIKNPRNPNRLARVELKPTNVDCIVFWTKNAQPMFSKLDLIEALGYPYYFQFTLTPYDHFIEQGLPPKAEIMESFKQLSHKIGRHRLVWRYDPVIISQEFSVQYHVEHFGEMCHMLGNYTNRCIFSFIDLYAKIRDRVQGIADYSDGVVDMNRIAQDFSEIAQSYNLILTTCSEAVDFSSYGITHAACIDQDLIESILGCSIRAKKDPNQRLACGCIESVDIGAYDCCSHGCIYCYARTSEIRVGQNMRLHDPSSPLLIGHPRGDEIMTVKPVNSLKVRQASLF